MYYCTVSAAVCGSPVGWLAIGGTSAAAPLMAGITADANTSAGVDLGFASPFLYSQIGSNVFNDIKTGSNNVTGGAKYTAGTGYDMVTGLGSVNAQNLATALHAHGPVPVSAPRTTTLTAPAPAPGISIKYGTLVRFSGTLTDTGGPVGNALVIIQLSNGFEFGGITESNGHYDIRIKNQLNRNLSWRAVYLGSDTEAPTITRQPEALCHADAERRAGREAVGRRVSHRRRHPPRVQGSLAAQHARRPDRGAEPVGKRALAHAGVGHGECAREVPHVRGVQQAALAAPALGVLGRQDEALADGRLAGHRRRRPLAVYSHSIVAGGLDEMSRATRLTPGISLMIRLEIRSSRSYGSRAQSAVIASSDDTARMTMG